MKMFLLFFFFKLIFVKRSYDRYVNIVRFPKWAQGLWEESLIVNGTMTFTDLNGYNSYTFITVESNEETGRFIVYFTDQW